MNKVVKRIIGTMSIGIMTLGISLSANAQSVKIEKDVKGEKEPIMVRANHVWSYHGNASDSPTDPSKYSLGPSDQCGDDKETICQISAPANPSNPSQPDMTALVTPSGSSTPTTIALRISAAQSSKVSNETVTDFRPF